MVRNVHVACRVLGDGDIDFVFFPGLVSNIELYWDDFTPVRSKSAKAMCVGIAAQVAARVAALAEPNEALVTRTGLLAVVAGR